MAIGLVVVGLAQSVRRWPLGLARRVTTIWVPLGSRLAPRPSPADERLKSDVTYLAADERDGRAPGTKGIEAAADYIADVFKEAGLKPAPGAQGYFQPFTISGPSQARRRIRSWRSPGRTAKRSRPRSRPTSPAGHRPGAAPRNVPVVFAGYGITAQDGSLKLDYDDYAGIDVKGKAV